MTEKDMLSTPREKIDAIDTQMARLFEERMGVAQSIARFKKEHGLRITDSKREEEILSRAKDRIRDENLRSYYQRFLRGAMEISKDYQRESMGLMRVAFAGEKGAFAHLAARRIFPEVEAIGFDSFESAYGAVEEGECDVAVLPLENSTAGDVGRVLDLAFGGTLFITGVYDASVQHNLLAKKGTEIKDITTVISHPQALAQCAPYLKRGGWDLVEAPNTALAAKEVAESNRTDLAAVASLAAAQEFDLAILAENIQEKGENTTRFATFSRAMRKTSSSDARFFMTFTVKNEAGALAKAIFAIGSHGFNLRAIKSRPTRQQSWEYYFFCEGEGNPYSFEGEAMQAILRDNCSNLKILGTFDKEMVL